MASTYNHNANRGSNKLLLWLIIVSLAVHIPIFLHLNDLLSSKILQYIDLSLQNIKKPLSRGIPRPPILPKEQKKTDSKMKILKAAPINLPDLNHMYATQGEGGEGISEVQGVSGLAKGEDYKEMVLRRIERAKKYPKDSDGKRNEATVTLSFIINPDGSISNLKILKPCPYNELNMAAKKAVLDSVPFPRPPANLYKGGVEFVPTLTFELL